jgi:hypothetical protein
MMGCEPGAGSELMDLQMPEMDGYVSKPIDIRQLLAEIRPVQAASPAGLKAYLRHFRAGGVAPAGPKACATSDGRV